MDAIEQAIYFNSLTNEDRECIQFIQRNFTRKRRPEECSYEQFSAIRAQIVETQRAMARADFNDFQCMRRAAITQHYNPFATWAKHEYLASGMRVFSYDD
jgi:hypothetical protein